MRPSGRAIIRIVPTLQLLHLQTTTLQIRSGSARSPTAHPARPSPIAQAGSPPSRHRNAPPRRRLRRDRALTIRPLPQRNHVATHQRLLVVDVYVVGHESPRRGAVRPRVDVLVARSPRQQRRLGLHPVLMRRLILLRYFVRQRQCISSKLSVSVACPKKTEPRSPPKSIGERRSPHFLFLTSPPSVPSHLASPCARYFPSPSQSSRVIPFRSHTTRPLRTVNSQSSLRVPFMRAP